MPEHACHHQREPPCTKRALCVLRQRHGAAPSGKGLHRSRASAFISTTEPGFEPPASASVCYTRHGRASGGKGQRHNNRARAQAPKRHQPHQHARSVHTQADVGMVLARVRGFRASGPFRLVPCRVSGVTHTGRVCVTPQGAEMSRFCWCHRDRLTPANAMPSSSTQPACRAGQLRKTR